MSARLKRKDSQSFLEALRAMKSRLPQHSSLGFPKGPAVERGSQELGHLFSANRLRSFEAGSNTFMGSTRFYRPLW